MLETGSFVKTGAGDVGQRLQSAFIRKSKLLALQGVFWVLGVAASIWFLTDTTRNLFDQLATGTQNASIVGSSSIGIVAINSDVLINMILIFPAIYAIYFAASEFRNTMKLKESYDFKATMATSLVGFAHVIESAKDDPKGTQKFLVNTATAILKTPMEEVFNIKNTQDIEKKARDMVTGIAETVGKVMPR